jgi:2-polyprenyl-3-methyl-5-hydroxy-6-metoxy-1,4-benzoquinol methylase
MCVSFRRERSMNRWLRSGERPPATEYDRRFAEKEAAGEDIHGEAAFVEALGPRAVLDAGCGTGRVGVELARRGVRVVGVDLDADMLEVARSKAPGIDWRHADLATVDLTDAAPFDVVVAAGNVMIFVEHGTEAAVVANLARHLAPGGALVAGFQLSRHLDLASYDEHCRAAGLELAERWATWDRAPWAEGGDYAVSVHRRP